jgi:hypothetical protein
MDVEAAGLILEAVDARPRGAASPRTNRQDAWNRGSPCRVTRSAKYSNVTCVTRSPPAASAIRSEEERP